MHFFLSSTDFFTNQSDVTKVKVHLINGRAEILDQHQDLLGLVDNDLVEFETASTKSTFVLQDAVFIVSSKGLQQNELKETGVYLYARRAKEISSNISTDLIQKELDQKIIDATSLLSTVGLTFEDSPIEKISKLERKTATRISLLKADISFLKTVLNKIKTLKG